MKTPRRVIKTAICVDPNASMGKTPEEEIKEHIKNYREWLAPAKIKYYRTESTYPGSIHPGTELVLFDYGGMMGWGNDLAENNSQRLINYAMDNPSTLCIVISNFTWDHMVKYLMQEMGFHELPNLVCTDGYDGEHIPKWFKEQINPPEKRKGIFCKRCDKKMGHEWDLTKCDGCFKNVCPKCMPSHKKRTLIYDAGKYVEIKCFDCEKDTK